MIQPVFRVLKLEDFIKLAKKFYPVGVSIINMGVPYGEGEHRHYIGHKFLIVTGIMDTTYDGFPDSIVMWKRDLGQRIFIDSDEKKQNEIKSLFENIVEKLKKEDFKVFEGYWIVDELAEVL
ncbi:MAG: hypothetical protein DRP01_01725 [Archaeoglobales archaeon]|nr:MAG: hypothetical protein DRP01_01725 [Archaeoglobales archaeon]